MEINFQGATFHILARKGRLNSNLKRIAKRQCRNEEKWKQGIRIGLIFEIKV